MGHQAVHCYVVRVAVAAGGVMGNHQSGPDLINNIRQPLYHLVFLSLAERVGVLVVRGAFHARVPVVQESKVWNAGHRHRSAQLLFPHLGQGFRCGEGGVADLAHVAVGGADHSNADAQGHQLGQGPAAAKPLVVGMSEYSQRCESGRSLIYIWHLGLYLANANNGVLGAPPHQRRTEGCSVLYLENAVLLYHHFGQQLLQTYRFRAIGSQIQAAV